MNGNTSAIVVRPLDATVIESVLLGGDLSKLSTSQRLAYYQKVCDSLGLNPMTKPFDYLNLNGKTVLYARKDCTEQLRQIHGISLAIKAREVVEGCYVVTAHAKNTAGREDESIGAVPIDGMKGEARSNAMMKAETKAKRRVTLSICGLGMLDETEVDSIPTAARVPDPAVEAEPVIPPAPAGYEEWVLSLESAASQGILALEAAWKPEQYRSFRQYLDKHHRGSMDALKARAGTRENHARQA